MSRLKESLKGLNSPNYPYKSQVQNNPINSLQSFSSTLADSSTYTNYNDNEYETRLLWFLITLLVLFLSVLFEYKKYFDSSPISKYYRYLFAVLAFGLMIITYNSNRYFASLLNVFSLIILNQNKLNG